MKSASKTLYTVGKVINIIEIVLSILVVVLGIFAVVMPNEIYQKGIEQGVTEFGSPQAVKNAGIKLIVGAAIAFVVCLIIFLLAKKASKSLKDDASNSAPHTLMLIIGIFGDIFYFLGGLFGILSSNEAQKKQE